MCILCRSLLCTPVLLLLIFSFVSSLNSRYWRLYVLFIVLLRALLCPLLIYKYRRCGKKVKYSRNFLMLRLFTSLAQGSPPVLLYLLYAAIHSGTLHWASSPIKGGGEGNRSGYFTANTPYWQGAENKPLWAGFVSISHKKVHFYSKKTQNLWKSVAYIGFLLYICSGFLTKTQLAWLLRTLI